MKSITMSCLLFAISSCQGGQRLPLYVILPEAFADVPSALLWHWENRKIFLLFFTSTLTVFLTCFLFMHASPINWRISPIFSGKNKLTVFVCRIQCRRKRNDCVSIRNFPLPENKPVHASRHLTCLPRHAPDLRRISGCRRRVL